MKKIISYISENILYIFTLFLLAFIPLYPKFPLLDIQNTWVYIRLEDILIAVAVIAFFAQLLRKKATLKTPLTIPIIAFWIAGLISTVYGVLFIFPTIANVFPNVAALHFIRYIEYLIVFFIAYSSIKNKNALTPIIIVLAITLAGVIFYGFGQKGFLVTDWENRFPAFSTMNEEFAKGIPLRISALGRVASTFAGHYDLAAYLVMIIAIMGSLIFGFKKWWVRISLFALSTGALILLMMTASRVSFAVYLVTVAFMLIIQRQKKFIIPVFILSIILLQFFQGLNQRFASTLSQVDVVVDARTGQPIGVAKEDETGKKIVVEDKDLTGEDLPQGSGFISIPGSTGSKTNSFEYRKTKLRDGEFDTTVEDYKGDFVVRRAIAYDVSFTTRFQGQWPRAIEAFKRNMLLGSGYSSISLATDNNYLRIIGETGLLGLTAFAMLFVVFGLYTYRVLPYVDKGVNRSFVLGVVAALVGLGLNAVLIDVFVASKVAFITWLLIGITVGILSLYEKKKVHMLSELKSFFISAPMIGLYFLIATIGLFSMSMSNFFVGDDFTWLRWAGDCEKIVTKTAEYCVSTKTRIASYFLESDGFFYRPGTKIYFLFMYAVFWLHQSIYHFVSVFLHFLATLAVFLLALRFLKNKVIAILAGILFMTMSVHFESIFWISVTGHMISSAAILFSLLFYIAWQHYRKIYFILASFACVVIAPLFQEFGIVAPIVLYMYDQIYNLKKGKAFRVNWKYHVVFFLVIPAYLTIRFIADSHWSGGDYSYNALKFPFNAVGNFIGYIGIIFSGVYFMPVYEWLRVQGRENLIVPILGLFILGVLGFVLYLNFRKIKHLKEFKTFLFGLLFFIVTLLPFIGFGNITYRYAYLPSVGLVLMTAAFMKEIFDRLKEGQKKIALIIMAIVVLGYSVFQYTELVRINKDWARAGEITSGLLNDVTLYYEAFGKTTRNPVYYFGDVPVKYGHAWVFPWGFEDSLWFPFQNHNITIKQVPDIDATIKDQEASKSARFFEFDDDGSVIFIDTAGRLPAPK